MTSSPLNRAAPYVFIAPFVLTFGVFITYPMLYSVWLAMHQTFGPGRKVFVGVENFRWLFTQDPQFYKALMNTFVYTVFAVGVIMPSSLALAMLLNRKDVRGRAVWRMIFFAPSLVGLAFVGIIASLIFEKNTGLLNVLLNDMTSAVPFLKPWDKEFPWLQEFVMPALIISSFWMSVGFNMVYFLAALQNVSKDLLEAARVDGAGPWQQFRHVTLPAIKPIATFVTLLAVIGSFQLFELPYLLLNNSAGPDDKGLFLVTYLFQKGFDAGDLGYASAIGWVAAVILFGFALIQMAITRRENA